MVPLLIASLVLQVPQVPAAPPAPPAAAAVLRGQVTDKETGQPIPRAVVTVRMTVSGRSARDSRVQQFAWQNFTDAEGRFEFLNLPAGQADVSASAGEHRATHASQSWPTAKLGDAEVRANVNIALARAFAISGRLTNEDGAPLAGMSVAASAARGSRPGTITRSALTDDRGVFRIFGLAPGQYVLCANPGIGPRPPNVTTVSRPQRYTRTCQPSVSSAAEAQIMTVTGFDVDGVEIRVRRSHVYSVSGALIDSNGAPVQRANVMLMRSDPEFGGGIPASTAEGRFVLNGVAPGEYNLQATIPPADGRLEERASVPIRVDADDVDIVVELKRPATISGHVMFEDGVPTAREGSSMVVSTRVEGGFTNIRPAVVAADLTFTLNGLFGRLRLDVQGLPSGWIVKSIRYRGEDITDTPAEFTTDPRHQVEVVVTSRTAQMMGVVTDDNLQPAAGAQVFLIPADPKRRAPELYALSMTTASKEGRFGIRVRAGEYVVVAVTRQQLEILGRQPAAAELLAKYGERLSLVENERLTMNLRVVTLPDAR